MLSDRPKIGMLGRGVFGSAIGSLLEANGYKVEYVDLGDQFSESPDILFLAVPVQAMRGALKTHREVLVSTSLVVNCSKGIEVATGFLPQQIVFEVLGSRPYVVISGPSFASEIIAQTPTAVSVAGTDEGSEHKVVTLLAQPHFLLEELGTVLELELAGAMKNIYAIAAGFVAGSGGGQNTHAHLQVVALREYVALIQALEGETQVVRPGVVGDFILTCGSPESRNFQYGFALAKGKAHSGATAEGVGSATAVLKIAQTNHVQLPLAAATNELVTNGSTAQKQLYKALGFVTL